MLQYITILWQIDCNILDETKGCVVEMFTGVPFSVVDMGPAVEPSASGSGASLDSPKSATLAL